jgi:hypothetical protein
MRGIEWFVLRCALAVAGVMSLGATALATGADGSLGAGIRAGTFGADAVTLGVECAVRPDGPGSALLCGSIDPHGSIVTGCEFEFGEAGGSYGREVSCSPEPPYTGQASIAVTAVAEGLRPGASYHYRLAVTTESGTEYGPDEQFSTPPLAPTVASEAATNVTSGDAVLEAQIAPGGAETLYQFEIAKSPACLPPPLPNELGCAEVEVGDLPGGTVPAGVGKQGVSLDLASAGMVLQGGATYAFRVVASNSVSGGAIDGAVVEFTVPESPAQIEQTEAAAKKQLEEQLASAAAEQKEAAAKEAAAKEAAAKGAVEGAVAKQREEEAAAGKSGSGTGAALSKPVSVTIVRVKVTSGGATVTLDASRAVTVTIWGHGLQTTRKRVLAGDSEIKVALTRVGRNSRKLHRRLDVVVGLGGAGRGAATSKMVRL